jgi:hypothetical protein
MTSGWHPYKEPLRATLLRTGVIALVAGVALARRWGGWSQLPLAILFALWPSFGGHWIEVWFLNWLRTRLPRARGVQVLSRLVVWFLGGALLGIGASLTASPPGKLRVTQWPGWAFAGLIFIGIELIAHLALQLRGRPSFYNGQG